MRLYEFEQIDEVSVISSWIDDLEYDEETETVTMTLLNGRMYWFDGIPKEIFDDWIEADSKGQYWHRVVKWLV